MKPVRANPTSPRPPRAAVLPPPLPVSTSFADALRKFQNRWRAGLFATGLLNLLFWAGLVFLAFGVLDFFAGFSDSARLVIARLIAIVAGAALLWTLIRIFIFTSRDAAIAADRALGSRRRPVLSAFELRAEADTGAPLERWLRQRGSDRALFDLVHLPFERSVPRRELASSGRRIAMVLGACVLCFAFLPKATLTIAQRLLVPGADIPPYSPLAFTLSPNPAEVLYGGELIITAEISGGKIEAPVRCLTREPGSTTAEESPVFQESPTRYSRKLEKMAAPIEIAFTVGRARSAWLPVGVLLQPRIQQVLAGIEPPAYSRLARREFALGTQDLSALPGSRITLRIESNRPLGGGMATVESLGASQEISGVREASHRLVFQWMHRGASAVHLTVSDLLGTRSEPLALEIKALEDRRPEVVLRQPAGDVFATPETELDLEASASDDLGLTRVSLVRKLSGYRERSRGEALAANAKQHEIAGKIQLASFGVSPGQTIELTLEAGDTNPSLLGQSVSEPSRIHIITREQYAEMLRAQTTIEEFGARYEALRDQLEAARETLEKLLAAADSGDPAATEEARKKAFEAHEKAAKIFEQIARDFPIFELDEALSKSAAQTAQKLLDNAKDLAAMQQQAPGAIADGVPALQQRLGDSEREMAEAIADGERALAAARVFDQMGIFGQIIDRQRELVKDLNRAAEQIRRGEMQAAQALSDLARDQKEIADDLRKFETELGKALDDLPAEYSAMQDEGRKFLELLEGYEVPPLMDESTAAAQAADSQKASERSGEALAKLEALLREKNGMCEMCRGDEPGFPWPQDLASTLRQLMDSLCNQPGFGTEGQPGMGGSGGQGFAGRSRSGYWMRGKMPQIPVFGPDRSRFSARGSPSLGGQGDGRGKGQGAPGDGAAIDQGGIDATAKRSGAGEATASEAVPEAYRDAVKRYFLPDDTENAEPTGAPARAPQP